MSLGSILNTTHTHTHKKFSGSRNGGLLRIVNVENITEVYTWKWLILCYVNFTSIFVCVCGAGDWTLRRSTSELHPQPNARLPLNIANWIFCVCVCNTRDWTQGHSTSQLHPSPILFFIWKQGLTNLLRLPVNLQFSCLSLPSTGITGMRHHAQLQIGFWINM